LGDFAVNVRQTERVVFVVRIWRIVSRQPAGVGFERNRRYGEKAVAVVGRFFVGRENKIRIVVKPELVIGFVGVVAQPDFFMRHAASVEIGNDRGRVGLGLERDVGGRLVEPLLPKQGVQLAGAQVVGAAEEKPARRGGVK